MNKELLQKLIEENKDKPQFDGYACIGAGNVICPLVTLLEIPSTALYSELLDGTLDHSWSGSDDSIYYVRAELASRDYTLPELVEKIQAWANARKIYTQGTIEGQFRKLVSEVGELADNLGDTEKAIDDIGDCFVCLVNLAKMHGLTLEQCGNHAWQQIKDRKGEMKNGTFVKEENP